MGNLAQAEDHFALDATAASFADAHGKLSERVRRLKAETTALHDAAMPEIQRLAVNMARTQGALEEEILANADLFVKPGMRRVSGVKIGFRKQPGKVSFKDEAKVIGRIRELLPAEQAYLLIRIRETVDKTALADLELADLRRIGVSLNAGGNECYAGVSSFNSCCASFLRAAASSFFNSLCSTRSLTAWFQ